jgi:hypothetical protein
MAKLTLTDVTSGYSAAERINANNTLLEAALENTLSRDGTAPNGMSASLDMNSNEILNLAAPTSTSSAARLADILSRLPVLAEDAVSRYGLVGDGTTDNSDAFDEMFEEEGRFIYIAAGDYVTTSFFIPSNTHLWLEPGTIIRDSGNLGDTARLINIRDVENVTIVGYGAKVLMDRDDYTSGEQRHGVIIQGSDNVFIEGLESSDSGGDGFYIGAGISTVEPSSNVILKDCIADNNRRQGLSIVSVRHCRVSGRYTNTTGTSPQAGIDIEPNTTTDALVDVRINDVYTEGNVGQGIKVIVNDLLEEPVDIVITNHRDVGSTHGFGCTFGIADLKGRIVNVNPYYEDNLQNGIDIRSWDSTSAKIEIIRPYIKNPNVDELAPTYVGNGISIYNPSADGILTVGNVLIVEPRIVDDRDTPLMKAAIFARNFEGSGSISNVQVIDPQELTGATDQLFRVTGAFSFFVRDPQHLARLDTTVDASINDGDFYTLITNEGASGTVVVSLEVDTATSRCASTTHRPRRFERHISRQHR